MSIRNLDALFDPSSIALVGASNQPGSIGSVLARNLYEGGFAGPILTVNPRERAMFGPVILFGEGRNGSRDNQRSSGRLAAAQPTSGE